MCQQKSIAGQINGSADILVCDLKSDRKRLLPKEVVVSPTVATPDVVSVSWTLACVSADRGI
jgi:hypothetical protein